LVDSFECVKVHGPTNPKFISRIRHYWRQRPL